MWQNFDELPFLIAEDSDDDLLLLQRAVRRARVANPHVVTTTGQETIEYLARALHEADVAFPILLFLDLLMPRLNGIAVLEWLNEHPHPPIAVVLHTGVDDENLLRQARDLGASFYLPKGARPDAIREVFRRARVEWEQQHLLEH